MPEIVNIPQLQNVDLEQIELLTSERIASNDEAKTLVTRTLDEYEGWRRRNVDDDWIATDKLYSGYVDLKTWPNSKIPRSNISLKKTLAQIQAALGQIYGAVFPPNFDIFTILVKNHQFSSLGPVFEEYFYQALEYSNDFTKLAPQGEFLLAFRQLLQHGNGGVFIQWHSENQMPCVEWCDLRDIYVDPACPTSNIEDARSIIRHKKMTIEDLQKLRNQEDFSIPSDDTLYTLSKGTQQSLKDRALQASEAFRGRSYNSTDANSVNPVQGYIDVHIYYDKQRIIWMLNREMIIYNELNPYGFYPFAFAPCSEMLGRFYADSLATHVRGFHLYEDALINARMDEVNMNLHPPRLVPQGSINTPAQQRWYPGATNQYEDPSKVILDRPTAQTANIYQELGFMDQSMYQVGVNSLGNGTPMASNANRTAAGMQMQLSAGSAKLALVVQNIEWYLLLPLLYKMHRMAQFHLGNLKIPVFTCSDGQLLGEHFNLELTFNVSASSRILTKDKVMQMFPMILQYGTSFQGELNKTGQTIDFSEIFRMFVDSTGISKTYNIARQMTPQEMQAYQQAQEAASKQQADSKIIEAQIKSETDLKSKEMESQTKLQLGQMSQQTELAKIQAASNPQEKMLEVAAKQQEMQLKQQESEAKLQMEWALGQMKAQQEQAKLEMQQLKAQLEAIKNEQKLAFESASSQQKLAFQAYSQEQKLEHADALHQKKMSESKDKDD